MRHRTIPTEKCYFCGQHNQVVYNKLETYTLQGLRRVHYCDSCHKRTLEARAAVVPSKYDKMAALVKPLQQSTSMTQEQLQTLQELLFVQ